MQKRFTLILVAVAIATISYIVCYSNSYALALVLENMNRNETAILKAGFDSNGDEYRVVISRSSSSNEVALIRLCKNSIGLWRIANIENERNPETGLLTIGGIDASGVRRFSVLDDPTFEFEIYNIFHGNNAIKPIELSPKQLPNNVTMSIRQAGEEYTIILFCYGNPESLNIDLHKLLIESKSIEG